MAPVEYYILVMYAKKSANVTWMRQVILGIKSVGTYIANHCCVHIFSALQYC